MPGLAESGHVGIVVDEHRPARAFLQPDAQGKVVPAGDLVRAANHPGAPVDRPAKTNPDRRRLVALQKRRQGSGNLAADAPPARSTIHFARAALQNRTVRIGETNAIFGLG